MIMKARVKKKTDNTKTDNTQICHPLEVKKVSKSFANIVLDDINFHVGNNEIVGIIGLNGIGKTTLLKIILGLLTPDNGTVTFFNQPNTLPSSREVISYLPEKFIPFHSLKGKEFLQIAIAQFQDDYDHDKVVYFANKLDLDPACLNNTIRTYSKGMAQKLGIICQFVINKPLLILDEPMSGLDPKARILMKKQLIDYHAQGNSVLFSSHILTDVREICDRVLVLHNAKFIFDGSPKQFAKEYKTSNLEQGFLKILDLHKNA